MRLRAMVALSSDEVLTSGYASMVGEWCFRLSIYLSMSTLLASAMVRVDSFSVCLRGNIGCDRHIPISAGGDRRKPPQSPKRVGERLGGQGRLRERSHAHSHRSILIGAVA